MHETPAVSNQASLEKIPLPKFYGNQADWQYFKDKFTSLVINQNIDDVIKNERLNKSLLGDAAHLINGVRAIGDNFQLGYSLPTI